MAERAEINKELTNLKSDMNEMKEHVASLARVLKDTVRNEGNRLVEGARGQGRRAYVAVESQVKEKPVTSVLTSMGVGMAVGVTLGWLLNRK